ncbi:acyltransferase family protein, partial [Salibacterium halotolerans]
MKKKIFLSLLMIIFAIFTAACGDQQKEKDNVSQGENQNESQNDSSDGESQASSFYDNSLFYGDSILKGLSNNLDNGHVISSSGGTTQFAMENVNKIVDQAPGGFLGVGVFFVLSGYLITDILMRQWKNKG